MHKSTILVIKKGQNPPDGLVQAIIRDNHSASGCTFVTQGDLLMQKNFDLPVQEGFAKFKELRQEFLDFDMVLCFENFPAPSDKEAYASELQPYVVAAEDDECTKPYMVCYMEGDYSNHALAGSSLPDHRHAFENIVYPRILQLWDVCGGDVTKVMEQLDKRIIRQEFETCCNKRGVIVLQADTGEILTYLNNQDGGEAPWGMVSQMHGYNPEAEVEPPKKVVSINSKVLKKPTVANSSPLPQPAKQPLPPAPKVEAVKVAAPVATTPAAVVPQELIQKPPKGCSNGAAKDWYNKYYGSLPYNWKDRPSVVVKKPDNSQLHPSIVKEMKDLAGAMQSAVATAPVQPKTPAAVEALKDAQKPKDTEAKHIPAQGQYPATGPSVPLVHPDKPLIPVKQREAFHLQFLKSAEILALRKLGLTPIMTVEEIEDQERKLPTFSEQVGFNLEETLRWKYAERRKLVVECPDVAAVLMQAYALHLSRAWQGRTFDRSNQEPKSKLVAAATAGAPTERRKPTFKKVG